MAEKAEFSERLRDYLECVRRTKGCGECLDLFLGLCRSVAGEWYEEADKESREFPERANALVGPVMVEVRRNLHWERGETERRVANFLSLVAPRWPQAIEKVVVTDGLHFHVYRPQRGAEGEVEGMELDYGFNLESPLMSAERAESELRGLLGDRI